MAAEKEKIREKEKSYSNLQIRSMFSLMYFHGGVFRDKPYRHYVGGETEYDYEVDSTMLCFDKIMERVSNFGYSDVSKLHYRVRGNCLTTGLRYLGDDSHVKNMLAYADSCDGIEIYVEHLSEDQEEPPICEDDNRESESEDGEGEVTKDKDTYSDCSGDDNDSDEDEELLQARVKAKAYKENAKAIREQKKVETELAQLKAKALLDKMMEEGPAQDSGGEGEESDDDDLGDPIVEEAEDVAPDRSTGYISDYADSSDYDSPEEDDDGDGLERREQLWPTFDPNTDYWKVDPTVGMKFGTIQILRRAMICYAVKYSRNLKFGRSTKTELGVHCSKKCRFKLWARKMQLEDSIQIRKFEEHHSCLKTYKIRIATTSFVSWLYRDRIHQNPTWKVKDLRYDVLVNHRLEVSKTVCRKAKAKALIDVEVTLTEHYKKLWSYGAEYKRADPRGSCDIKVHRPNPNGPPVFQRFYVCMEAVQLAWKAGCRPIIGVDGCFLKGYCKGELLVAIGRDGNNQMFPIAWAQVEVENKATWSWFLDLLMNDLDYIDGNGLTIVSDQQKGLIEAVKEQIPKAEHRHCSRHIYANFRRPPHTGAQLKKLFWLAAKVGTSVEFDQIILQIREVSDSAASLLMAGNFKSWPRGYYTFQSKCDAVENNMCESFNKTILEARPKPIIEMFEGIRIYVMERMQRKREDMAKWDGQITQGARKKLEKNLEKYNQWHVYKMGDEKYEVKSERRGYIVDLKNRSCTCRHWDLSGIPCCHAIGAIYSIEGDPEEFVHWWYHIDRYKKAYDYFIPPLNGETLWPQTSFDPIAPPLQRRMPGRPKKNRMKGVNEETKKKGTRLSKKGVVMTCTMCSKPGHNKASCILNMSAQKKGYWVKKTSLATQESTNLGSTSTIPSRSPPIPVASRKEGRSAAALAACRTLAEELTELRFPAPRILAFKEGSSQARYFVSRLIPAHRDPPYEQEARFPQLLYLNAEQRVKLKSSFIQFDDMSFCEWMRSLKLVPTEPSFN